MTNEQIKETLQSHLRCAAAFDEYYVDGVDVELLQGALDTIEHQQTEIAALEAKKAVAAEASAKVKDLFSSLSEKIDACMAEAIREFAVRLKKAAKNTYYETDCNLDIYEINCLIEDTEDKMIDEIEDAAAAEFNK